MAKGPSSTSRQQSRACAVPQGFLRSGGMAKPSGRNFSCVWKAYTVSMLRETRRPMASSKSRYIQGAMRNTTRLKPARTAS